MRHPLSWLRTLVRLVWESLRDGVPLLFSLLKRLFAVVRRWCRRRHLSERERRRAPGRCVPIHEPAYKRPDPLIYSQQYLMTQGIAVTWDNPDIQLYRNGIPVSSSQLDANITYDIVARIWNNSTEAPVVNLPVRFSYLSFGVGGQSHPIGDTLVLLGVKGGADHPAFAKVPWTTPATPGHYCIQVLLDWLDDANPNNNLGQENTNVAKVHSPAEIDFLLRNPTHERLRYRFEVDSYGIPPPPRCDEAGSAAERRRRALAAHDRQKHPLPSGWSVEIAPPEPEIAPGAEQTVHVTVNAPPAFDGRQAINVHAFSRYGIAGGVTIYVEAA